MEKRLQRIGVFFLILALGSVGQVFAEQDQQQIIRAKIGIQVKSGKREQRAKSRQLLKKGDLLRIYVHPEESSFIYVVHATKETVTLLNMTKQQIKSSTLILPSILSYYEVDGNSAFEQITVVCSPQEIVELSTLGQRSMTHEQWTTLNQRLQKQSKIVLSKKSEVAFALAGNVRSLGGAGNTDSFAKQLQIYSGQGLLVKHYEFKVR